VTQWRKGQGHYLVLLAEFQKFHFWKIWMGFDLHHPGLIRADS
jgi:hypothetical protein